MQQASHDTLTLVIDQPQDGLTNMAVDEALLTQAAAGELGPVLRFYQWSPATLSLGYFQRYAERALHPPSEHCAVVRRASGGGAILHDRELTYSLVLPAGHPLAARAEPLYRAVHQALIDVLAAHGLDARFWDDVQSPARAAKISASGEAFACGDEAKRQTGGVPLPQSPPPNPQSPRQRDPFLCFQRRSPGDLVLRAKDEASLKPAIWHKILGSAQRRRHGAVFAAREPAVGQVRIRPRIAGRSGSRWHGLCTRLFSRSCRGVECETSSSAGLQAFAAARKYGGCYWFILGSGSGKISRTELAARPLNFRSGRAANRNFRNFLAVARIYFDDHFIRGYDASAGMADRRLRG